MLNSDEKEALKRIEKIYRENSNYYSYTFKIRVNEKEHKENQEVKVFFEKCRDLGYIRIVDKYGSSGTKPDERWEIEITPQGSMYLNS